MIVRHTEKGWEIISHYAHGLLAGKIASQLKQVLMPEHWIDVLTGIIEHDDHLLNFDEQEYLTHNGTPKDFTMKGGTDGEALEHAKRVFYNAVQKSQLVALLVGRHLEFLYKGLAEKYVPMKKFLGTIKGLREKQRKLYGLKQKDEDHLYDILLFSDRCSLILCQDGIPEVGRKLEINLTIRDRTYFIERSGDGILKVEPWPFESSEFRLDFEYRILSKATFNDNSELEEELGNAEIILRSFVFKK